MKESGINHFFTQIGLDTGTFSILYTFEEKTGVKINSISGGNPIYSGILQDSTNFWIKPGSGFSSGSYIQVQNTSGLYSNGWTQIFVYEKININNSILFSSLNGTSGYNIGLTDSNKPYLESVNNGRVVGASYNNYSSKNVISISYLPNFLNIGYYNFNSQLLESESFDYYFNILRSDNWKLLPNYTGFIDYWMYFNAYYSPQILTQLFSGFGFIPTGTGLSIQNIFGTGITGYQSGTLIQTGVTGYSVIFGGGSGYSDYTDIFSDTGIATPLTGIISSGTILSGIVGIISGTITGSPAILYDTKSGYIASFGMEKIQMLNYIDNSDCIKDSYSRVNFDDFYNKLGILNYSGYYFFKEYNSGIINLYLNGVGQSNSGWFTSGIYLFLTGSDTIDDVFVDIKSGDKKSYRITGLSYAFQYSGQEIYLNGVNLISGLDFTVSGSILTLTSRNTGISGEIFEYPIVLNYTTGTFTFKNISKFDRNTSNIYLNGIREQINKQYIECGLYDNFSGNYYNNLNQIVIYNNNNLFWE